ncbi:MAG: electron transfer flavoprotein subunit alpha/FixB family protein, partial [Myxococcales bacterium]|nr:electron transfer flavoprotein subunit alpha/FixB family protein [Myxococcales bacterium]
MGCVLVVAEQNGGALKNVTKVTISFAQQAAKRLGCDVVVAVFGERVSDAAGRAAGFGAAKVLTVEHPALAHYLAAPYAVAVSEVAKSVDATVVCIGATSFGKDLAPRVAVRLGAGLASDITDLAGDGANLLYKRP